MGTGTSEISLLLHWQRKAPPPQCTPYPHPTHVYNETGNTLKTLSYWLLYSAACKLRIWFWGENVNFLWQLTLSLSARIATGCLSGCKQRVYVVLLN